MTYILDNGMIGFVLFYFLCIYFLGRYRNKRKQAPAENFENIFKDRRSLEEIARELREKREEEIMYKIRQQREEEEKGYISTPVITSNYIRGNDLVRMGGRSDELVPFNLSESEKRVWEDFNKRDI